MEKKQRRPRKWSNGIIAWMVIRRKADNVCFLWNGEQCLKVTPGIDVLWHYKFGEMPEAERDYLNKILHGMSWEFSLKGFGSYMVIQRGTF